MNQDKLIAQMRQEIQQLKARVDQRAIFFTTSGKRPYMVLTIVDGNELETGQDGIVYEANVATVPSAYDPTVTSTFIDGIGRATLHIDGVAQADYVLVVNDSRGTFGNALLAGDQIFTEGAVSIPVDGGGSVRAYVAG